MFDYHTLLGIAAACINVASFCLYVWNIFYRIAKPHPFTWFIWGLLTAIGFFAQLTAGAGAGAWLTGTTSLQCFLIASIALRRGEKRIAHLDWGCLAGALASIIVWQLTHDPLTAILLVVLSDGLAFVPTFRKAYLRPLEETATTFTLGIIAFSLSLAALQSFNLTSALFPAFIVITNFAFVVMLLIRRRVIRRQLPNVQ